jgi:hypothetical protein
MPANLNVVPFPGAPSGVADAYIKQSVFPNCMANGLPASKAHVLAATQLPLATIALTQQTGAWQTIPSWAVAGTADHAIPLTLQFAAANTAHARITRADAPHPIHDLQSRYRDERDPASRPGDLLTQAFRLRQQLARSTQVPAAGICAAARGGSLQRAKR